MFKPFFGVCSQCDNEGILVVKKLLCARCNHKNKEAKKKASGKKTGGYKYVREANGEGEMMRETILNMLPDEATVCFVCKTPIAALTYSNMAHVISKGKFPLYRLNPDNLKVLCHKLVADENGRNGCHGIWDFRPRSEIQDDPAWQEMIELEEILKEEYKKLEE